jgi:hypothetical protein
MGHDNDPDPAFDGLRRLVASDPKLARAEFASVLASDPGRLAALLEIASMPGEGRLRQMVATTARLNPDDRLQPWLTRWLSVEADEFTRAAIEAAVGQKAAPKRTTTRSKSSQAQLVETYRYVSDRLCHRVRNTLTLPGAQFVRLQGCIESVEDPGIKAELTDILAALRLSYQRLARAVEFDTGDDYLAWADFDIVSWIGRAASDFASRYGDASLTVVAPPA